MPHSIFLKPTLIIHGESFDTVHLGELSRLRKEMEKNRQEMSESKDRVDISLKEYEELKRVNKDLLNRLNHAEAILGALNIPADFVQRMVPESVKWWSSDYVSHEYGGHKHRYRIEFDTEEYI